MLFSHGSDKLTKKCNTVTYYSIILNTFQFVNNRFLVCLNIILIMLPTLLQNYSLIFIYCTSYHYYLNEFHWIVHSQRQCSCQIKMTGSLPKKLWKKRCIICLLGDGYLIFSNHNHIRNTAEPFSSVWRFFKQRWLYTGLFTDHTDFYSHSKLYYM